MNWHVEEFFLAQAPGPGVGTSNIKTIGLNDTSISADPIENISETWERDWTARSDTNIKNTTAVLTVATKRPEGTSNTGNSKTLTATPTGATDGQNHIPGSGLLSNTKAGIAVGVIRGVLALPGVILLSCLRGRRTTVSPQEKDMFQVQDIWVYENDGRPGCHEVGEGLSHEDDVDDHEIHELDVRGKF